MARDAEIHRLEDLISQLAVAQLKTERVVSEAQARSEARMDRIEETLARLAEAQARSESSLEKLAQQVGRLSDTIGFTLEDLAREVSPSYLQQHYGIQVAELERRFFRVDSREIDVDFYGKGKRDGEVVAILGEVRSRIYAADVESFARQAARLASQLPGTIVTVLFGFVIHPSARDAASKLGAILISSSGR